MLLNSESITWSHWQYTPRELIPNYLMGETLTSTTAFVKDTASRSSCHSQRVLLRPCWTTYHQQWQERWEFWSASSKNVTSWKSDGVCTSIWPRVFGSPFYSYLKKLCIIIFSPRMTENRTGKAAAFKFLMHAYYDRTFSFSGARFLLPVYFLKRKRL